MRFMVFLRLDPLVVPENPGIVGVQTIRTVRAAEAATAEVRALEYLSAELKHRFGPDVSSGSNVEARVIREVPWYQFWGLRPGLVFLMETEGVEQQS